jgi:hypothetical protein
VRENEGFSLSLKSLCRLGSVVLDDLRAYLYTATPHKGRPHLPQTGSMQGSAS